MSSEAMESRSGWADPSRRAVHVLAVVVAAAAQVVVLVPFTVASGLVAPLWAVVGLYALGAASIVALVHTARRRPLLAPAIPLLNGVLLFLAITGGERLLGWTA